MVRALEIIGEASKKIPGAVRQKHPELPWPTISGMRDRLIHEYFGVDAEVVWRTVQEDLPMLRLALERLIAEAGSSG